MCWTLTSEFDLEIVHSPRHWYGLIMFGQTITTLKDDEPGLLICYERTDYDAKISTGPLMSGEGITSHQKQQ